MTEQDVKMLFKLAVQNGNHKFTDIEKELLKKAIDESKNVDELLLIVMYIFNHE